MTDLKLKIYRFIKENKKKIILVAVVWGIVIAVNYFLKYYDFGLKPITTYTPNEPIMDTTSKVPKSLEKPIEDLIDEYFNYCNNHEYEKAYQMLSSDCKTALYPTIEEFEKYANIVFDMKKIYNIQNYSNDKNMYIYRVRILDDILSYGIKADEKVPFYEEKFVITKDKNELKLSIGQYIETKVIDQMYEDQYMKIVITNSQVKYNQEVYKVKITNRSEYIIVLADYTNEYEIVLNTIQDVRNFTMDYLEPIVLYPSQTNEYEFKFAKYYDEVGQASGIIFNTIRILNSYSGIEENIEAELEAAEKLYSIELKL